MKRALPALLVVAVLALAGCGGDDSSGADSSGSEPSSSAAAPTDRGTPTGTAAPADVTCTYEDSGRATVAADKPPSTPVVGGQVKVTFETAAGDLPMTLDAGAAPCTVNQIVSLVEQGWYDGGFCPRLSVEAEGYQIIQCGDSSDSQGADPGWQSADELTGKESYTKGVVAMANAGPGTQGGQFFVVYGGDTSPFSADYTIIGSIDEAGMKVISDYADKTGGSSSPDFESLKIERAVFG